MSDNAAVNKDAADAEPRLPVWYKNDLVVPFRADISHTFLLHGNISDLVANPDDAEDDSYISLRKFFDKTFYGRAMVMFYNIASGITFLESVMEKEFRKLAGIESEDGSAKDPVAAAKAGLAAKRGIPRDPDACLALAEKVLKLKPGSALVVNSVHFIAPASGGGLALLPNERANVERIRNIAQDEDLRKNDSIVLFLTEELAKVSMEIRQSGNEIQTVFIPKPDKQERTLFIQALAAPAKELAELEEQVTLLRYEQERLKPKSKRFEAIEQEIKDKMAEIDELPKPFPTPKDFSAETFAHATQGMNLRQILEIFLHSKKTEKPLDLVYVKEKKREILNNEYGDVMELVEARRGLEDIGGLEHIKAFLKSVLEAIARGEERLVSMGIMLMGPPGTGKTAIVEALAREAGFNFVKTKNIRSMWVGESEARQQKLIYGLRSLAPVVVMNDEADLNDAQRDAPKGDSGVSERMMKAWMELLSDPKIRGQIIVISCTNRPDRIDPALKRSGRTDERILIPMPSKIEIPMIFEVMFKRYTIPRTVKNFAPYAEMVDGLSGADVEKIVQNAFRFAFEGGKSAVDDTHLREAIEDFIPSASQSEIDRMTILSVLECSSRRLLPPNIRDILTGIKRRNLVENLPALLDLVRARNIADFE